MKEERLKRLLVVLGAITLLTCVIGLSKSLIRESNTRPDAVHAAEFTSEIDVNLAIKKLSIGDWAQADQSRKLLLDYSNRSQSCRKEVIDALVQAMTKPNLNFVSDRSSYFLWLYGSPILGDLKAVETLDLLIDHLDVNDGLFSASMVHQPAVLGVEAMGVVAVPKLRAALQHNANRNIRLAVALCLMDIGGEDAMNALKQAGGSELDSCVSRFIRISIEIKDNELNSKTRQSNQSYTDKQIELRRQLLMAFKCDD